MEKSREKCGGWTDEESIIAARWISSFFFFYVSFKYWTWRLRGIVRKWREFIIKVIARMAQRRLSCITFITQLYDYLTTLEHSSSTFSNKTTVIWINLLALFLVQQAVFLIYICTYIWISSTCWTPFINVSVDIENVFPPFYTWSVSRAFLRASEAICIMRFSIHFLSLVHIFISTRWQ